VTTTTRTLSEQDSKDLLADYGVPFAQEVLVTDGATAAAAVAAVGRPCALKLCGDAIAHKTERGLVRLGVTEFEAAAVAEELLAAGRPEDGVTGVLVAEMVRGNRELIAGIARDPQFGPTLLLGVGGILAEALADVAVRVLPVERVDALEMLEQLELKALLAEFRGEPAVDAEAVADVLMGLAAAAQDRPDIVSVDLNPLVVRDGRPVAVDALVELEEVDA
jgi:acetyl-CoA synthetase (ADP-forming)